MSARTICYVSFPDTKKDIYLRLDFTPYRSIFFQLYIFIFIFFFFFSFSYGGDEVNF